MKSRRHTVHGEVCGVRDRSKRKDRKERKASVTKKGVRGNIRDTWEVRPVLIYAVGSVDRKGRFPIEDQIVHSYAVEKLSFRSQYFRSSNPIRVSRRKYQMHGSACSIDFFFEYYRISHHPRKHTITPYNSPDAGLTAAAAAAASHSDSAWHILFSARQQRVLSSDGSSACHR